MRHRAYRRGRRSWNDVFRAEPLSAGELALVVAVAAVIFVAVEIEKWVERRAA